jgi:peroxiredoxin
VLSDPGNAYARQLSLVFALPDDLREIYRTFGIDLPVFNGDESWELPLPARIVVDASGTIRSLAADPDYTRRPEPEETLAVLRSMSS